MLKSKCLNLILDIDFMTLKILKLEFFYIPWIHYLLVVIITNFVGNHQFNVILLYLKNNLENYLLNITYLHTTCIVFLNM